MKQSFLSHFTYILIAHILLLFASWQVVKDAPHVMRSVQQTFYSPGTSTVHFRMATYQMHSTVKKMATSVAPSKAWNDKNPADHSKTPMIREKNQESSESVSGIPSTTTQEGISGSGSLSASAKVSLRQLYYSEIRSSIEENKTYPIMGRRLGQQGLVVVAFTLLEDGHIINLRIDTPSRYDLLNSSALDAVKKVHKFRPIPKELDEVSMDIKVPIRFFTI